MVHKEERREMYVGFQVENLKERDCLKDQDMEKRIILKWILKE
jgi:hypothetical protein